MRVVSMYLDNIYSVFLDTCKMLSFTGNYYGKVESLGFGSQNKKISKIRESHFVKRSILRRLEFFDCILLQNWTLLQPSNICRFFNPKWRNMTSLKRHFVKKLSTVFFLKSLGQTWNWCWGRYWKFCFDISHSFLDIGKIQHGGGANLPPQRVAY